MIQIILLEDGIRVAGIDYPNNHLVFDIVYPDKIEIFDSSKKVVSSPYTNFLDSNSKPYLTAQDVISDLERSFILTATEEDLQIEIVARISGDETLQSNIDSEENARISADSGLSNRTTNLEDNELKILYYSTISTTTGQVTIPTQATVILDDFPYGLDAVVETIVNGKPSGLSPTTAGGSTVTVTSFDSSGNYILSGIPSSFPVALLYVIKIKSIYLSNTSFDNRIETQIIDAASISYVDSGLATKQPLDSDLTTIAAINSGTGSGVLASDGSGWFYKTYSALKTALSLTKSDVGLGNVDNTSDANKPVSTAQQTALDLKANKVSITGDTKTKVTYNSEGIVTAGADSTTSDISEGTNLYYTDTRFDTRLATKTTTNLTEGSNLYFTVARVLATALAGLNTALTGTITSSDTVLTAFGRIQNSLDLKELLSNKSSSFTVSSTTTYTNTKALVDGLATKEPNITGTTTADFWSGGKTFINFASTALSTLLTGLSATVGDIVSTDSILIAFNKVKGTFSKILNSRITATSTVTINADTTKFDVNITGEHVHPTTGVRTVLNKVQTGILDTNLSAIDTYVWLDCATNTVIQSTTPPDPMNLDDINGYWVLIHSGGVIVGVNSFSLYSDNLGTIVNQILFYIGFKKFPGTNLVTVGTTGSRLSHSGGEAIKPGGGDSSKKPLFTLSGQTDATFLHRTLLDTQGASTQTFDTTNYNPSGSTVSALSNNKFTAALIWKFASSPTAQIRPQYGQFSYDNFTEALNKYDKDPYVLSPNGNRNGVPIAWIIFKKGTTLFTGTPDSDYKIINIESAGTSGGVVPTMQNAYDASSTPQYTINATRNAVQYLDGRNDSTLSLLEFKDFGNILIAYITGAGNWFATSYRILGTGGNGFIDLQSQSSDPSVPASGIRRFFNDSINKLASLMSNGTKSTIRGKIYSDLTTSSALTGTTTNTLMKSALIKGGTFSTSATDTLRIESAALKTGTAGTLTQRYYVNTSASLSGATLLGTQSAAAGGTFLGMVRNGQIKSTTNTEFIDATLSVSGDEAAAGVGVSGGKSSINIDWTIDQYIIQAAQNASAADSTVSSFLKIYRD